MPQTAVVHEHAATWHFRGNGAVNIAKWRGEFSGLVGTRHDSRGAIVLGKISYGPHRITNERYMRTRHRNVLIISVPRLRRFVLIDAYGRYRGDQTTAADNPLHDAKHLVMLGNPIVRRAECEQIVNPNRTEPLEKVLGWLESAFFFDTEQILGDQIDEFWLDYALEDGIPVALDTLNMVLDVEGLERHVGEYRIEAGSEVN